MEVEEYQTCSKHKPYLGSSYPQNKVPKRLFLKDPSSPLSEKNPYTKTCYDCRLSIRKLSNEANAKKREKRLEERKIHNEKSENSNVKYCVSQYHTKTISFHPRNEVPEEKFRKVLDDSRRGYFDTCIDCRNRGRQYEIEKKNKAKESGRRFCGRCFCEITEANESFNLDGSLSVECKKCKERTGEHNQEVRDTYKNLLLEYISKNQCMCVKCKSIYLNERGTLIVFTIPTYARENGKRCVLYGDEEFSIDDLVAKSAELFAFEILVFDHLTEEEQRERKLLKEDEKFIPKVSGVHKMKSETSMKVEATKCQLLCYKCHIEETIRREKGKMERGILETAKLKFVTKWKEEGCSYCGYKNPDLLRFFEFNHVDRKNKIATVSEMVKYDKYSVQDFLQEVAKCNVLCGHCHKLHTALQNKGIDIFVSEDKDIPLDNDSEKCSSFPLTNP